MSVWVDKLKPQNDWEPLHPGIDQKRVHDGKSVVWTSDVMSLLDNSNSGRFPEAGASKTIEFHFSCANIN